MKTPDCIGIFNPREEIAGWDKAATEESESRSDAMLGFDEDICGLKVRPLTFRHILWLNIYQNIFQSAFTPDELLTFPEIHLHVARFMWVLSPKFRPFGLMRRWLFFRRYKKASHKIGVAEIVRGICKFMDDSTFDLRADGNGSDKSYYSACASVVHSLSSIYGLSPFPNSKNAAIDLPLKIVGQILRVQIKSNNPKAMLNNRTDILEQKWLEEENLKLKRN